MQTAVRFPQVFLQSYFQGVVRGIVINKSSFFLKDNFNENKFNQIYPHQFEIVNHENNSSSFLLNKEDNNQTLIVNGNAGIIPQNTITFKSILSSIYSFVQRFIQKLLQR